jgi:glycosyltransferase involved in cell wall biosynthesis
MPVVLPISASPLSIPDGHCPRIVWNNSIGMLRVLIVSFHFPPDFSVGAKRVLRMASYLSRFGWETTVLTVRPGYFDRHDPTLMQEPPPFRVVRTHAITPLRWARRLRGAFKGRTAPGEAGRFHPPGDPVVVPEGAGDRPVPFWRPLLTTPDEYVGWIPLAIGGGILRRLRSDLILASGPPFSSHLIAAGLSRALGAPLALDYRDPWTMPSGEPALPESRPSGVRRLESWCVGRASVVIATTGSIEQSLAPLHPRRTEVIPNAADLESVEHVEPFRDTRFSILYTGSFYGSRSPRPMLEAIRLLKAKGALPAGGLVFRVIGVTGDLVVRAAAALGVSECVAVEDFLPYRDALSRIRGADVLLLVVGDAHHAMVPAKLFDYLAARRYVLALGPAGCEAGRIVQESGAGEIVDSDDVSGIARVLAARMQSPRADLPASSILERYSPQRTMESLDRVLRDVLRLQGSPGSPTGSPEP